MRSSRPNGARRPAAHVTIIPLGRALGARCSCPKRTHTYTSVLETHVTVLMGAVSAEELS